MIKEIKKQNRAFVILFAVTISAILLSIALGVTNIAFREVKFSTSAKDSNDAFFAADAGIECAMVYDKADQNKNAFTGTASPMYCADNAITPSQNPLSFWTFTVSKLGNTSQGCAIVTMDKRYSTITVTSKGYNNGGGVSGACTPGLNSVERQIELSY